MEKWKKWQKIGLRAASYVLVAALASVVTYFGFGLQPSKLDRLQDYIEDRFIGEVDMTAVEDAAADAMVRALGDRWSYYISASEYEAFQEGKTNSYVGIGITIQARADGVGFDILQVEPESPAEKAGIRPGDILIEADGQPLAGKTTADTSALIGGKAGTEVSVSLIRTGEKVTFQVKRAKLRVAVAQGQMLEGDIGYVKIKNFNENCADETLAAIDALVEEGAQALIFDVRNNPGGYVDELVEVLDYLLPEGELFRSQRYTGQESVDKSDADCLELPMAVLVNGSSYSAAEFFAAALEEYDWATIVGEPTVGKSYFQNTLELGDGSAVGLSVGKYFTPNGVSLAEEGGLTPDVVAEVDEEMASQIYAGTLEPEADPQIRAAIEVLQINR